LFFTLFCKLVLFPLAGYSDWWTKFIWTNVQLPCLICSLLYYYYKYGKEIFRVNVKNVFSWFYNWLLSFSISLVFWTQMVMYYALCVAVQPILPERIRGYMMFPQDIIEAAFPYYFYFFCWVWVLVNTYFTIISKRI